MYNDDPSMCTYHNDTPGTLHVTHEAEAMWRKLFTSCLRGFHGVCAKHRFVVFTLQPTRRAN